MLKVLCEVGGTFATASAIIKSSVDNAEYAIDSQEDLTDPVSILAVLRVVLSKPGIERHSLEDLFDFLIFKHFVQSVELVGDYLNSSESSMDGTPALSDPNFIPGGIVEEQVKIFNSPDSQEKKQYAFPISHWRQHYQKYSSIDQADQEYEEIFEEEIGSDKEDSPF